ncbi:MAG: BamA/TamA family outer membrane protein [Gilvibacter sp.]
MKQSNSKIIVILLLGSLMSSCNAVKRVKDNQSLLTKNEIVVDGELIKDDLVYAQLSQQPNTRVLKIPFSLHIFNLAKEHPDSTYNKWLNKKPKRKERLERLLSKKQVAELGNSYTGFNNWIKKTGEAPVIVDTVKLEKSKKRLERYYARRGWFRSKASYTVNKDSSKRATVTYNVAREQPYIIDSITKQISSPIVDSIFEQTKRLSFLNQGDQYEAINFENEIDRLTIQLRNSGLFYFEQDYVTFEADTVKTNHKANITYIIPDRSITEGDSTYTKPFEIYNVNKVRIITDYSYQNREAMLTDSVQFNQFELYSYKPQQFKPKAITDAIAITPGKIFRDIDRSLTNNQISDLRVFRYPTISYDQDPEDPKGLIATILLTPLKKYNFSVEFDAFTSTVQEFGVGFSTTLSIRNVFKGAETLEISARGSLGSSKDNAESDDTFFNISDVGGDARLSFPRILSPFNTERLIPKFMAPRTVVSAGFGFQNNIGLDRQNLTSAFNYTWEPVKSKTWSFDLANIQYVRNLNIGNYFNVYRSSYDRVNEIARDAGYIYENTGDNTGSLGVPSEIDQFIDDAIDGNVNDLDFTRDNLEEISSIEERQERLSEDNLIFSSALTYVKDSREDIYDNTFYRFRAKVESAGNLMAGLSRLFNTTKNADGNFVSLGVVYSQYIKFETDYIKHWEINDNAVVAIRAFGGIAIPYGNSNSIPFTRSYFGGGANDNRGWRPYDLGPGSSGSTLDFNEANFKLAFNAEYRFTLLGAFKGALFVDAGNIWNLNDIQTDPAFTFDGFSDLSELAIASGFGVRYDFGFFVLRLDTGFKTHNPARAKGDRWFKEYNFANSVINIGVNYPF